MQAEQLIRAVTAAMRRREEERRAQLDRAEQAAFDAFVADFAVRGYTRSLVTWCTASAALMGPGAALYVAAEMYRDECGRWADAACETVRQRRVPAQTLAQRLLGDMA